MIQQSSGLVSESLAHTLMPLKSVSYTHLAVIRTISGVYSSESKGDAMLDEARALTDKFAQKEGRRPRIMVAKMGQDGHDRGAKVVATGYADCGFDVDMGPLFQTPAESARQAVENDVHEMCIRDRFPSAPIILMLISLFIL